MTVSLTPSSCVVRRRDFANLWQGVGRKSSSLVAVLILFCAVPGVARANFEVCNQTLDVVNVAIGQWDLDDWETSGWWTVGPNQCANVIEDTLTARFVYVFARDVFNRAMLPGATPMCVDPQEFRIRGARDCPVRGHLTAEFLEVDTRRSERWTLFLNAPEE